MFAFFSVQELGRLYELASVLSRYGFAEFVRRLGVAGILERAGRALQWNVEPLQLSTPARIRRALEEMGPTFIKLGQLLATRVDLFPPDWIEEFEKLQDQVPPLPFDRIRPHLEEALGGPLERFFSEFEPEAIAGASLSQVHRARLKTGKRVAVKIRRPGVEQQIEADLRLLMRFARLAEREVPELRRYRPVELLHQFAKTLRSELNFLTECRNAERIASLFKRRPEVVIPKMFWELSSEQVNVQEFIEGIPAREVERAWAEGIDVVKMAHIGSDAMMTMILIHGFFHADPHPGNLFFLKGNRLAFLDFGMVGRLSEVRRFQIVDLLAAVIDEDAEAATKVLLDWAGEVTVDEEALLSDVFIFIDAFHGVPLGQLDIRAILGDLTELMREYHLVLPPDLALLFKTLLTLDGTGRLIDPDYNFIEAARSHVHRALVKRYRPDIMAKRSLKTVQEAVDVITRFPHDVRYLLRALKGGSLRFNVDVNQLEYFGWILDRAASRLTVGMVTSALIIGSAIVMTVKGGPQLGGLPLFGVLGFVGASIGGVWLLISIWRGGHPPRQE